VSGMPENQRRLEPLSLRHSKLWIIVVVLSVCSTLAGVFWYTNSRVRKSIIISQDSAGSTTPNQELSFRLTMIFDGRTDDGERYANNFFKASDCASLSEVVIFFNSIDRAQKELVSERAKASAVVEQTAVTNNEGGKIGDRVVLRFDDTERRKPHIQVMWTSDKDFHSIAGPSLEHVLQFENAISSRSGRIASKLDDVQKVTFTAAEISNGRTDEGSDYSERRFHSSDCESVIVRTEGYPSPARAQEEFIRMLKASTTIIERGPRLDGTGQQSGERAVAMFKAPVQSEHIEDTIIMWTDNSELHSIKGPFTHAMEFETRNYRTNQTAKRIH
jgi:hypothetical protein